MLKNTTKKISAMKGFPQRPNPALKRLSRLIGVWKLTGRSLGAKRDNVKGRTKIEWLIKDVLMVQRGEINVGNFKLHAVEII
jgi:hypothetical protein